MAALLLIRKALPADAPFVAAWQGLVRKLFDPYRPERHYMRGPGPKWHAKHKAGAGR
jgi:hypothetical protein